MNDSAIGFALTEARALIQSARFWIGFCVVVVVLGLSGPFGTYEALPLAGRLAYWSASGLVTFWLAFATSMVVAVAAEDRGVPPPVALLLGGLAASLPVAVAMGALNAVVFANPAAREILDLLPYTAIIVPAVVALYEALSKRQEAPVIAPTPQADPEWLTHLPPEIGRDLQILQAQDHYVLAKTPQGQKLIRASLSDATRDLGSFGLRVHRSWWVARGGVERLGSYQGAPVVVLHNGTHIPVGRAYRRHVREVLEQSLPHSTE